ncbi:coiled-coil domain-containing protein 91 isoform X5 [Natator depressus]|uniref:coiled-coil domain-containing protein 91 isoform X5 n=1 Tax=Natator depressus TaxID=27790 RepID=UPI003EB7491B
MDDDDFGGFEAAVTFEGEDGETQTISPAIPWAAFPAVSEVHVSQTISSDVLLEHSLPSACVVPSDSFILSGEDVLTAVQTSNSILNPAVLKEQVQLSASSSLDISIPSLSLTEGKLSEKLTISVGDSEKQGINGSKKYLQPTVASLEIKLKDAEEERYRIKKEKHKLELEDMRKAGHEALTIIVEEFKHQRLLDMLDTEKEVLAQKVEEALMQQSQKHKEALEKCLEEQQNRSKEALAAAAKIEKEVMQEAILKAVEEERRNMEKIHAVEREIWQAECAKDKEKIAQAVQEAVQEQRKTSQEVVKAAIMEEQKRSEKAVEEAVKKTREELMEYIKEQKRLDQVVRQRSLCSLELFLSCAQKQLNTLIKEEPVTSEQKRETENLNSNENV